MSAEVSLARPDAWFARDEYRNVALTKAVGAETEGSMNAAICGEESPDDLLDDLPYACTRSPEHKARHIAVGVDVVAAWPGTHEPTVADLVESSSGKYRWRSAGDLLTSTAVCPADEFAEALRSWPLFDRSHVTVEVVDERTITVATRYGVMTFEGEERHS